MDDRRRDRHPNFSLLSVPGRLEFRLLVAFLSIAEPSIIPSSGSRSGWTMLPRNLRSSSQAASYELMLSFA
jgi:hypothetical protein